MPEPLPSSAAQSQASRAWLWAAAMIALLLVPGLLAGQAVRPDPGSGSRAAEPRKPMPQGSVSGMVLCTDTHTPARGARVMLMPAGIAATSDGPGVALSLAATGLDGRYTIPHVAPGEYFVLAFVPGYLTAVDGVSATANGKNHEEAGAIEAEMRKRMTPVRVSGAEAARADIELMRGGVLSGKVTYADGSAATQVLVLVQRVEVAGGAAEDPGSSDVGAMMRAVFEQSSTNRPDDQGHFRLASIPAGTYRVAVMQTAATNGMGEQMEALQAAMHASGAEGGALTVYAGNTMHRKQAKVFEVRTGETVDGIDIVLPLNGMHRVSGVVAGKDGVPLDAASLVLTDSADPAISFRTMVRAGGEFHFAGVPEGTYELKSKDGRMYQNPVAFGMGDAQIEAMDAYLKPTHAFGETTQALIVKDADVENVAVTPVETALPVLRQGARGLPPPQDEQPDGPQE